MDSLENSNAIYHHALDKAKGVYHHLGEIFQAINEDYFENSIEAKIRWSSCTSSARKRSITLGTYQAQTRLIRIHPALDQAFVPRFCIEHIVHHEMLHQKFPTKRQGRRLVHHSKEFLEAERYFLYAQEADRWLKDNLCRILKFKPLLNQLFF